MYWPHGVMCEHPEPWHTTGQSPSRLLRNRYHHEAPHRRSKLASTHSPSPNPVAEPTTVIVMQETKLVFEKLYKFVGKNIKALVDRPDEPYCFRLQKNRVYYVRESLMKKATNVSGIVLLNSTCRL